MKKTFVITALFILIIAGNLMAQYQVPLYAPGNTSGLSSNNNSFVLLVTGQNLIGKVSNSDGNVYLGLLAPLAITITEASEVQRALTRLGQNFPNPFKVKTTIPLELVGASDIRLNIFDVMGHKKMILLDKKLPAGQHLIPFNGEWLNAGIYFYQLECNGRLLTKTMVITK